MGKEKGPSLRGAIPGVEGTEHNRECCAGETFRHPSDCSTFCMCIDIAFLVQYVISKQNVSFASIMLVEFQRRVISTGSGMTMGWFMICVATGYVVGPSVALAGDGVLFVVTESDLVGAIASVLVLATFSMQTMFWLRLVGIASNVAFLWYGLSLGLFPIWALHGLLLPLNLWRFRRAFVERSGRSPQIRSLT